MLAMPSRTVAPTPDATGAELDARGDPLWQPKWDGIRAFAYVGDDTARLVNRLGVDISDRYPDVIAALAGAYPATESRVFDGELLVFHDGRPESARVHRRDAQSNTRRIYHLTQSDPATFMAFDLLYADGRDLRHDPLTARLSLLSKMVDDGNHLMISPTSDNGSRLWQIVVEQHLEEVVQPAMCSARAAPVRASIIISGPESKIALVALTDSGVNDCADHDYLK
jgi:bifunctional non-homologous end joining protein LigD